MLKETSNLSIAEPENQQKNFFSGITGAVIGEGTAKVIIPLIFIILVVVIAVTAYYKRKPVSAK